MFSAFQANSERTERARAGADGALLSGWVSSFNCRKEVQLGHFELFAIPLRVSRHLQLTKLRRGTVVDPFMPPISANKIERLTTKKILLTVRIIYI